MAKLSSFKIDSKAVEEGEWVSPGEEYDDLEIRTKGFNDRYSDSRAIKLRKAAMRFGNDINRIPQSISREITVECMIQHCLLDVRNIVDDNGKPVSFPAFCDMLRNPDYADLIVAVLKAAAVVGMTKQTEIEDAKANLSKPSK